MPSPGPLEPKKQKGESTRCWVCGGLEKMGASSRWRSRKVGVACWAQSYSL
jgi:hypothetical protein